MKKFWVQAYRKQNNIVDTDTLEHWVCVANLPNYALKKSILNPHFNYCLSFLKYKNEHCYKTFFFAKHLLNL